MHDVEAVSAQSSDVMTDWRDFLEQHQSALIEKLSRTLEAERRRATQQAIDLERDQLAGRIDAARTEARRMQTEALHQALRRMRLHSENREILQFLNDSVAPFSERSVVVVFENSQAVTVAVRGGEDPAPIRFELNEAPALAAVIESRDTVVALAAPGEISSPLAALFEEAGPENSGPTKAYLFPLSARQSIRAILVTAGAVVSAPIELLCEAAGMKLEAIEGTGVREMATAVREIASSPLSGTMSGPMSGMMSGNAPSPNVFPSSSVGLVQLTMPPVPATSTTGRLAWGELSTEDQQLHLQAQRTARVRVASLRLNHDEAVKRGLANRDIYSALGEQIDNARREFLRTYIAKTPTMVDYLHLEILASLAHNDEHLLGGGYPGPMV